MQDLKAFVILVFAFLTLSIAAPCAEPQESQPEALEQLPGKAPLIQRSYRPKNFESTTEYLEQDFTPNNRFFVRSHLANVPKLDLAAWKLEISGESVEKPLSLSFKQLRQDFKQVDLAAVLMCAGNRRSLANPRVPGVQWKNGAIGNAKWRGIRLKDVLQKAGVKADAVEVVFDGADSPVSPQTPDFVKSLPLAKALDENTLIAFKMNGVSLPEDQGFPARLIVPGWAATYWVKQLISIRVVAKPFDGYWMKSAYRIPKGKFKELETPWKGQETDLNTPITEIAVNSLITNPSSGQHFKPGETITVRGHAWDSGKGIKQVEVSTDQGKTWQQASLGKDYGNFSWRPFSLKFRASEASDYQLMSRATNLEGQTQNPEFVANPGGYHHNVPQAVNILVSPHAITNKKLFGAVTASETINLVDAPGRSLVLSKCILCHSSEYISMNSGFLDQKDWEVVVIKMQKKMGAPISDSEIPEIVSYLSKNYGKSVPSN